MENGAPRHRPFDLAVTGDLVLPGRVLAGGTLAVREGRIAAVLAPGEAADALTRIDCSGRFVLPGLVDSHVHTGSAPSEGIARATAAAAAGGVTTIIDMPYDAENPVFNAERFLEKSDEVESAAVVDVALFASIPKRDGVKEIDSLVACGASAFKFSLFETDPERFPRILDGDLFAAFEALAATDLPIVIHAELQEIIERRLGEVYGRSDALSHGVSRPPVSETAAIAKTLELARWSGARVHIAHVTHPHGFELIDWYAREGAPVSGETCVHYLALSETDVCELGPIAKVNPPIRDAGVREQLWRCLREGKVATVSTDHAPWPFDLKQRPILEAASGVPGLETFLPVLWTEAMDRDLPPWKLVEHVADNPAVLFGLGGRKGRLEVGYDADFVVLDGISTWVFDASRTVTSAKWSPFDGRTLTGKVEATYLRGQPVFRSEEVVAEPGFGRWLRRVELRGADELAADGRRPLVPASPSNLGA